MQHFTKARYNHIDDQIYIHILEELNNRTEYSMYELPKERTEEDYV
jgi:hypothetical protein